MLRSRDKGLTLPADTPLQALGILVVAHRCPCYAKECGAAQERAPADRDSARSSCDGVRHVAVPAAGHCPPATLTTGHWPAAVALSAVARVEYKTSLVWRSASHSLVLSLAAVRRLYLGLTMKVALLVLASLAAMVSAGEYGGYGGHYYPGFEHV